MPGGPVWGDVPGDGRQVLQAQNHHRGLQAERQSRGSTDIRQPGLQWFWPAGHLQIKIRSDGKKIFHSFFSD